MLVEAPSPVEVPAEALSPKIRQPRRIDFAARDEANRRLGRAGEQWVLGYEQQRLHEAGCAELFQKLRWVSEEDGDGTGYDILSFEPQDAERYIEVKTTNASRETPFVLSRNEVEFSREAGARFHLYRVFDFGRQPRLYILTGDVSRHLHLEPMDYRASFRRLRAGVAGG